MQKHGFNIEDSSARWTALLDGLSVERLTALFLERVLQLNDYHDGALPASEIRRTATVSFSALIESLRPRDDSPRLVAERHDIALDVGVSRARAGVPVESLMTAIRLDFTILWSELMNLADASDAELLVRRAETVWEVVDSYASQAQAAYILERQRMAQEATSLRQGYVAALFGPVSAPPEMLARIARGLGVGEDAILMVAAAAADNTAALHLAVAAASRRGADLFTHPLPDGLVVFWVCDERSGSAVRDAAEQVRGIPCGLVERVHGLAGLRLAAQTARALAALAGPGDRGALTMRNAWARLARHRLAETGIPMVPDVDAALQGCGPVERERLQEAVSTYLATGSIARSAEQLFCHRNTLMNRLRRFTELTGIDVMVPEQAARLVVAWS
ncbi:helix-turn-helix domain-containing protein [Arthrobacter sp. 08Y14]|uniref:helix-turn-helix domain-containing protein n=1 Tax=Arthrobacter sp. 08Y14 TaxID=2058885 RepID=UPI000CE322A7|nr:helix-turn-helix domain-containing protein [Arthrobacter sp. 08Y14]